jgi:hypothetical protein
MSVLVSSRRGALMKNKLIAGLFFVPTALLMATIASGQVVTYDFTGVVISSNDSAARVGEAVTGDYTFNFSLFSSSNLTPPNGTAPWFLNDPGLEGQGIQQAEQRDIFTTRATVGSLAYATAETTGPGGEDELMGQASGSPGKFGVYEYSLADPYIGKALASTSSLSISDPGSQIPYTAAGLPILSGDSTAIGAFTNIFGNTIDYRITSLRVVAPELDWSHIAGALTLLIGGLLVLKRRRPTSD